MRIVSNPTSTVRGVIEHDLSKLAFRAELMTYDQSEDHMSTIVMVFLPDNEVTPFVTWRYYGGHFASGDYCRTYADAVESFRIRCGA